MKQGLVPLVHLTIKTKYSYPHIDMWGTQNIFQFRFAGEKYKKTRRKLLLKTRAFLKFNPNSNIYAKLLSFHYHFNNISTKQSKVTHNICEYVIKSVWKERENTRDSTNGAKDFAGIIFHNKTIPCFLFYGQHLMCYSLVWRDGIKSRNMS